MGLDNLFDYSKPQASSFFILSAGGIGFIKPVPDFLDTFFGNADSAVLYRDKYLFPADRSLNINYAAVMAEFDGVVNQVVKNLLDFSQIRIYHQNRIGKGQVKRNFPGIAGAFKRRGSVFYRPVNVKIGAGKVPLAV